MSTTYTSIRVPAELAARLRRFATDLEHQAGLGTITVPDNGNTGRCDCPLWFAVEELLNRSDRHRDRARRSTARRRAEAAYAGRCMHPLGRTEVLDAVA